MSPPAERSGGESTAARSIPTPFLTKTYQLVDDEAIDDVISWNDDGSSFIVWNPIEFAKDMLPKYFKHNNFSSFVRQLNTYGFRKVVSDRWEFSNDCFRRGEKGLLCDIQRRKIGSASPAQRSTGSTSNSGEEQVLSSNPSHGGATNSTDFGGSDAELVGENERLRRENVKLNKELSQMKQLCNNIYVMMSNYATNDNKLSETETVTVKPLDLLPLNCDGDVVDGGAKEGEEQVNNMLFGVRIGMKRAREGRGGEFAELQLKPPGGLVECEASTWMMKHRHLSDRKALS